MNLNFEHYLALLPGLFWICLFVPAALAVVGIFLARKLIAPHRRNPHHEIAHALLGPIATVFGILGAFIVATTWHEYADTRANLTEESTALRDIYFDAQAFAPEYCHKLQNLCELYRDTVLTNEWRIVRKGKDDLLGNEIIHKISNLYRSYPLVTTKENIYFTMGVETLAKLRKHREQRLEDSYMGLLPLLWILFLLGGTALIFVSLFMISSPGRTHAGMVVLLAMIIGIMTFAIISLDFPFVGLTKLSKQAFLSIPMKNDTSDIVPL